MLRAAFFFAAAFVPTAVQQATLWAADVAPGDPTSFLPSLGIGGAVATVLYLWLRSEQKRGDRLESTLEVRVAEQIMAMQRLSVVVEASVAATKASTEAMEDMTKMMEYRWPTRRSS